VVLLLSELGALDKFKFHKLLSTPGVGVGFIFEVRRRLLGPKLVGLLDILRPWDVR